MQNNKDTISASQISRFLFCPVGFRLEMELKERAKPNIYMIWGSAIHGALELNYKQKIKSKQDLSLKEVHDKFSEVFTKELKNCERSVFNQVNPDAMVITGENVLAKYLKEEAPKIKPKYVEHEFKLKLKNYPITIHGFIDLITEEDVIKDYKTIGKTNKDWTQYKADDSIQLTLYSAAFRKMFLKEEKGIEVDLIPREDKPIFKTIFTTRTQEQVKYVLHLATVIQELKNKKIFYANLSNCRACPYNSICKKQ